MSLIAFSVLLGLRHILVAGYTESCGGQYEGGSEKKSQQANLFID